MSRPSRQHAHLVAKIAETQSKTLKKPGKRIKRWKKWAEQYKTVAAGTPAAT